MSYVITSVKSLKRYCTAYHCSFNRYWNEV